MEIKLAEKGFTNTFTIAGIIETVISSQLLEELQDQFQIEKQAINTEFSSKCR
jgi:hypothetical protein